MFHIGVPSFKRNHFRIVLRVCLPRAIVWKSIHLQKEEQKLELRDRGKSKNGEPKRGQAAMVERGTREEGEGGVYESWPLAA